MDFFFISSNSTWGGSEILWSQAALQLRKEGHPVRFGVKYDTGVVKELIGSGASYCNLNNDYSSKSFLQRALIKGKRKMLGYTEPFLQSFLQQRPSLVIISQGNNIDGRPYMTACRNLGIPFVTITQLVTKMLLTFTDDTVINELRINYATSLSNYFVSADNLALHNTMMGEALSNSVIVGNPFAVPYDVSASFPSFPDNKYRVAVVGRLEMYHKGHDLLFEVLQQEKWRNRNIEFSIYGAGPHKNLLERLIKKYNLANVSLLGQTASVADIWKNHQLLVLPSRMEGQSLALIEAMWCSRSAVVTDVGGARQLLEENVGFVSAFPTVYHLDKALEDAWGMRDQWEQLGVKAGQRIRSIYTEHPVASFVNKLKTAKV